jgi:hypothetical protein
LKAPAHKKPVKEPGKEKEVRNIVNPYQKNLLWAAFT